ncbi:uncharacterized protein LOC118645564 isoform X2 [Monomorium pharaonis]|uniref:uncharacterized protein LOC118644801 n=1 Tax=Monomorium pharaonis TaxID=307658 RepID=UPI0017464358|nr:uncharacterized protein LOC118644801 [Monomorium pharaonis]XP_036140289.1 uncharacterized protein LOC118644801 [Monomorium pharaonis]XP_036140290.1 uncharacterized protein LOC118644801 [Monomorium pharaonis]XP_036140951.1 uncharacterized protein LOC118644987 isoform X2 [Monomorium pharaonis]XP_036142795.1 uncharacterized protein LOC118645564 isoform X2 [Monomorium pharaonis]
MLAAAIIIATSQVKDILGLKVSGTKFVQVWRSIFEHIGETSCWYTALGIVCIIILLLLRGRHKVVMNEDKPLLNSDGNLLIQDIQENEIFAVPMSKSTLEFFNLYVNQELYNEASTSQNNESMSCDNGSNDAGCSSKVHSNLAVSSTASWRDDNEVKCLIYLWRDYQKRFKTMKSRDVWALICEELQKTSSEWRKKTAIQCENKWKDIKRKYTEVKDHNNQSGNDPKTCKFYEELEDVLGEKPCVKPVAVASSLNKRKMPSNSEGNFEEINEDSETSTQSEEIPYQRKKKMTKIQRELKDWSAALIADAKVREEAKERRHREAIAESKNVIDAYKEIMNKLIDKL